MNMKAVSLGFAVLCIGNTVLAAPARICELAMKRGGLSGYDVKVNPAADGSRTVRADIDADGANDELRWTGPAAGTAIPAGGSTLTLTLTSSNQSFRLDQQQLLVVKFDSRYYVVTTQAETVLGPWYREVFAVTREGFTSLCSTAGKGEQP